MSKVEVSLAAQNESRACLALLPRWHGETVEVLAARRGGAFAGAAAIVWQSWRKPAGFPIEAHVLPGHRRRGVGRALLRAAADLAAEETDGLWSHDAPADASAAEAFMLACGFQARERERHFEARIDTLLDHIRPLLARLRRAGADDGAVVPLEAAPMEDVAWLVANELGGGPSAALRRVRARAGLTAPLEAGGDPLDRSQAIVQGGAVNGVILWRRAADGEAVVDARIVAPARRGGATNLALLEAGLLRGRAEGMTVVRFHCDETVRDTIRLAQRCEARETTSRASYYLPFEPV